MPFMLTMTHMTKILSTNVTTGIYSEWFIHISISLNYIVLHLVVVVVIQFNFGSYWFNIKATLYEASIFM
jgi:hypothetical protein